MGRAIIKLNDGKRDWYLEWSTVVDAPVSYGMNRVEAMDYLTSRGGLFCPPSTREQAEASLQRADKTGTSWFNVPRNVEETIACNRAGPNETELTREEIIKTYCDQSEE